MCTQGESKKNPLRCHQSVWTTTTATTAVKTLLLASLIYGGEVNGQYRKNDFKCTEEGYHADPKDCHIYYRCVSWGNSSPLTTFKFECGPGTVFSHVKGDICVHPNESERPECNESGNDLDSDMHNTDYDRDEVPVYPSPSWPSSSQQPSNRPSYIPPSKEPPEINEVYPSHGGSGYPSGPSYPSGPNQPTGSTSSAPSSPPGSKKPPGTRPTAATHPSASTKPFGSTYPSGTTEPFGSTSSPAPAGNGECQEEGFIADPEDCKKFIRCVDSGFGSYKKYEFTCGEGTLWDSTIQGCNHAWAVKSDCSSGSGSPSDNSGATEPEPIDESNNDSNKNTPRPSEPTYPAQPSGYPSSDDHPKPPTSLYPPPYPSSESDMSRPSQSRPTSGQKPSTTQTLSSQRPATTYLTPSTANLPDTIPTAAAKPTYIPPSNDITSSAPSSTTDITSATSSEQHLSGSDAQGVQRPSRSGCSEEGFFADPKNCRKFFRCVQENQALTKYEFECGEGTAWDSSIQACNHEYAVPQCGKSDVSPGQATTSSSTEDQTPETEKEKPDKDVDTTKVPEAFTEENTQSSTNSPEITMLTTSTPEATETTNPPSSTAETSSEASHEPDSFSTESPKPSTSSEPSEPSISSEPSVISESSEPSTSPTPSKSDDSTEASSSLQPSSSTTPDSDSVSSSSICKNEGFYPDPSDCRKFIRCVKNNGGLTQFSFDCASGTAWDQSLLTCNYIHLVPSCNSEMNEIPSSTEGKDTEKPTSDANKPNDEDSSKPSSTTTSSSEGSEGSEEMPSSTDSSNESSKPSAGEPTDSSIDSTTEKSETSTDSTPSTTSGKDPESSTSSSKPQNSNDKIVCEAPGFYGHPTQCDKFYRCVDNGNGFTVYHFDCPPGTIFDPSISLCNHPESVYPPRDCAGGSSTPSSTSSTSSSESTSEEPSSTPESSTSESSDGTTAPGEETTVKDSTSDTSGSTEASTDTTEMGSESPATETPGMTDGSTDAGATETSESTTESGSTGEGSTASPEQTTQMDEGTTTGTTEDTSVESTTPEKTDEPGMNPPCSIGNLTDEQIVLVCPTGFRRHPKYCNMFYQCTMEDDRKIKILVLECPESTIFDDEKVQCLAMSESTQACNTEMASARLYRQLNKSLSRPIRAARESLCPGEGHYPYKKGCSNVFYKCKKNQRSSIQGYLYRCPNDYVYWSVSRRCERASRLPTCSRVQDEDREEIDTWKKRWELPVEESNLSARMIRI